jgi:uncharacterized protein YdeI (YjbR/CyaY-like superfamily)
MIEPESDDTFFARDRRAWRSWLSKNHAHRSEVWLLFYKKHTGKACVTLAEAVEEALCFGWIDGKLRRIDDERHILRFCPRRPNSIWSEVNKKRVLRLIKEGLMTPAGLRMIAAAKKNGQWAKARELEQSKSAPPGLMSALSSNSKARLFYEKLAPSHQKMYVAWVLSAKREETRQRRIQAVVIRCERRLKPGIDTAYPATTS